MNKKFGFTIIELLIVITIIGILLSVILPRMNSARDRGIETKIIAELDGYYKNGMSEEILNNTFDIVCGTNGVATSTKLLPLSESLQANSDQFVCNSSAVAFAASAQINATEHWCVDSVGSKGVVPNALPSGQLECP
jgi:prepilin-type N-terminal cleavage/methylation domain-containing protein